MELLTQKQISLGVDTWKDTNLTRRNSERKFNVLDTNAADGNKLRETI